LGGRPPTGLRPVGVWAPSPADFLLLSVRYQESKAFSVSRTCMQWSLVLQLANKLDLLHPRYYGNMNCSMLSSSASCAHPAGCSQKTTASQLVPHSTQLLHLAHWRPFAQSQPATQSSLSYKCSCRTHAFATQTREVANTDKVRNDCWLVVHCTQAVSVLANPMNVTTLATFFSPSVLQTRLDVLCAPVSCSYRC
jgi:hypothetical protein